MFGWKKPSPQVAQPQFHCFRPQPELLAEPRSSSPAGRCTLLLMAATERHFLGSDVANFQRVASTEGTYYDGYDADNDKAECYRNEFWQVGGELLAFEQAGGDLRDAAALLEHMGRTVYSPYQSGGFAGAWHSMLTEMVAKGRAPATVTMEDLTGAVYRRAEERRR